MQTSRVAGSVLPGTLLVISVSLGAGACSEPMRSPASASEITSDPRPFSFTVSEHVLLQGSLRLLPPGEHTEIQARLHVRNPSSEFKVTYEMSWVFPAVGSDGAVLTAGERLMYSLRPQEGLTWLDGLASPAPESVLILERLDGAAEELPPGTEHETD